MEAKDYMMDDTASLSFSEEKLHRRVCSDKMCLYYFAADAVQITSPGFRNTANFACASDESLLKEESFAAGN